MEDLTIEEIAKQAMVSPYYFQKGFAMLCGFSVREYIKKRRLALAGSAIASTDEKIIDIALAYGYESPDSFTKAFCRFHGATPAAVRKGEAMVKSFAPLAVTFTLTGGYMMDYKIMQKASFTIVGLPRTLSYENVEAAASEFWQDFAKAGYHEQINSCYGISIDQEGGGGTFEYLIAGDYAPWKEIPKGFVTRLIPEQTWAVFACHGALNGKGGPGTLTDVYEKIFRQWLPSYPQYQIAAGYHVEWYDDPTAYPLGVNDEKYYSEIWIPVTYRS